MHEMTEARVNELLEPWQDIDGSWRIKGSWSDWVPGENIQLDDNFSLEHLEAIVWFMRSKGAT